MKKYARRRYQKYRERILADSVKYYQRNKKWINKKKKVNNAKFFAKNKKKILAERWRRFGIINSDGSIFTLTDYCRIFKKQKGKCYICGVHSKKLPKPLFVDHDHKTGKARGLLCNTCNAALGFLKEDWKLLIKAVKYLRKDR